MLHAFVFVFVHFLSLASTCVDVSLLQFRDDPTVRKTDGFETVFNNVNYATACSKLPRLSCEANTTDNFSK